MFACGKHEEPLENHGDIVGDGKFTITVDNHPRLYGEKECFFCHQEFSLHQVDRGSVTDLETIRATVKEYGLNSCSTCHGSNDL